jgi:hypothetical protein
MNLAAILTLGTRHGGMDVGFVLKEVEMSPRSAFGVMNRLIDYTAGCTNEFRSAGKANLKVNSPIIGIKINGLHLPRRGKAKGSSKQTFFVHGGPGVLECMECMECL